MADVVDKPSRKSVSFADSHAIVDNDGNVKEQIANGDGAQTTAESHTAGTPDAAVDEVTDMFASLAKKKKPKKKKESEEEAVADGPPTAAAGEEGELDLSSLSTYWMMW
jgi:translation initiation factor 2 subunit 2